VTAIKGDDDAVLPTSRTALPTDDPRQQGWEIETFSTYASDQLKHIDELLGDAQTARTAAARLAATAFQAGDLRPAPLVQEFASDWLTVRRWAGAETRQADDAPAPAPGPAPGPASQAKDPAQQGPTALISGLQSMVAPVGSVYNWRSKEKVFAVEVEGDRAQTDVYYQLYAEHARGTLQVNATWRCQWVDARGKSPRLTNIEVLNYEEVISTAGPQPLFRDCTVAVLDGPAWQDQLRYGVDHWLTRIESRMGIDIGGWQGLAVGDVNDDGLDDVYLTQPGGLPNRLYIQNPDGTATERAVAAGVAWLDSSHAALMVDMDNDLDQDLLVAVSNGVLFMANDGQGKFRLTAAQLTPAAIPYSLAAADYDVDGDLDVYVCCYNPRQGINRHLLFARPVPYHDANNGGPNVLLQNDATPPTGPWQFRYATHQAGMDHNNQKFSYAAAWEDYDNDGDLDLYVANDFGRNNLYRNDGGRFRDVADTAKVDDIGPGMSACWGDYDNDGWMDLYVSNMFSSAGNRITQQSQFQQSADASTRDAFRRHARGNSLFSNRADGTFTDVTRAAGVMLGRWAWGSRFADLNNDGWQDLLVMNGFITQADTEDL
jgi:hypothetical protein